MAAMVKGMLKMLDGYKPDQMLLHLYKHIIQLISASNYHSLTTSAN